MTQHRSTTDRDEEWIDKDDAPGMEKAELEYLANYFVGQVLFDNFKTISSATSNEQYWAAVQSDIDKMLKSR